MSLKPGMGIFDKREGGSAVEKEMYFFVGIPGGMLQSKAFGLIKPVCR
ncbi:MAG: hypothetical protein U0796_02725 [Gemmatales bacterium]